MPYDSRTYRVLIASPSDVQEERELVVRVIQEWNDLYSYTRKVVLLPVRWETHTAPEYGTRPQEAVNRAIVDNCDLLVGVFWTRIGTPTGAADSGTLEEISRVAKAGKPIMLYFSKVGMDPDKIDLAQLQRLQAFKQETYPNALTESFKSQIEFRDKFAKQIELKVRDLQKADDLGQPSRLSLEFVSRGLKHLGGPQQSRTVDLPEVSDLDDYISAQAPEDRESFRDAALERIRLASTADVLLAIRNTGSSGVRNLYVEMSIRSPSPVEIMDSSLHNAFSAVFDQNDLPELRSESLRKVDYGWEFTFEWDALQPQRYRVIRPRLLIRAASESHIDFTAKVFADSFPAPIVLQSRLDLVVRPRQCLFADIVPDVESLKKTANAFHTSVEHFLVRTAEKGD